MRTLTFITLIFNLLCAFTVSAQVPETPLVSIDFEALKSVRDEHSAIEIQKKKLFENADKLLNEKPLKVVDGDTPPSGDIHDFFAIGKLAFPNPKTPNGLPYIRKDGVTNPEADGDRYDLSRYNKTLSRVNDLSLAWFYSRDEKYATKAAELLRVWFIDPKTRMNPNLNNASALPGVHDGMPIGIIFSVALIRMVDHVKILALSESWTSEDNRALKKWFADYRDWLLESDLGKAEARAGNNHGSWYAAQVAAFSIYNGEFEKAKPMIALAKKQIPQQIQPDGSMPREYKRERSLHYSIYGLQAFTYLARCAEIVGDDLWNFKSADEKSLRLAFSFLYPYVTYQKEWPWKNIAKGQPLGRGVLETYQWAAKAWSESEFAQVNPSLWKEVPADASDYLYWRRP